MDRSRARRNHVVRAPLTVSLVDLVPTLCELAGLDAARHAPEPLDGRSLMPLCEGGSRTEPIPVFGEITSEGVPSPMFMVREGRYKLTTGGGVASTLYDLESDPSERDDLAARPEAADVLQRMESRAAGQWDATALNTAIQLSQKRRRLVLEAHRQGQQPDWEHRPSDAATPWLLRGEGLYNDWAWQGIDG